MMKTDSLTHIRPVDSNLTDAASFPSGQLAVMQPANPLIVNLFNTFQVIGSEAYVNGLELPDGLLKKLLDNVLDVVQSKYPELFVPYDWLLKESERLAEGSRELMQVQYDLPTQLFRLMLTESNEILPKYTMALWEKGAVTLQEAQRSMLDDVFVKAGIQDGDHVLDLGCGWGASSNYLLAKFPNCRVTGLNLSHEQCQYMREKMKDPHTALGSGRFTLCEQDFNLANFDHRFDKVLAIGLFEHVGNLTKSFEKLATFLKEDGKVFLHFISSHLPYSTYSPFLNRYIFPHMRIWSYDAVPQHDQHLKTMKQWYLNGANYAKTLACWLENFDAHQDEIRTLDFSMDYSKFRRIWRFYLILCIAYFHMDQGNLLGNAQYLLTHRDR
jgi:cyclopropane-fatty-acyl-phospholipid synthase